MENQAIRQEVTYFEKPGAKNTETVLQVALQRAREKQIRRIVVATCSGKTAFAARRVFGEAFEVIAVTHVAGFAQPNEQELSAADRETLIAQGVKVQTCQHAFAGIGRGIRNKLNTYQLEEIMAYTLRIFGQGTKVAVEIALMAADAGLVRTDEDIIAIGGSAQGADTALLLQPACSSHLFDLRVKEILCKPGRF